MPTKAPKAQMRNAANPLEVGRALVADAGKQLADKKWIDNTFQQLMAASFGTESPLAAPPEEGKPEEKFNPKGGVIFDAKLNPSQVAERRVGAKKQEKATGSHSAGALDYDIKNSGERAVKKKSQERRSDVERIQAELQQIINAPTMKEQEKIKFAPHTLSQAPKRADRYDVHFFNNLVKAAMISKEKAADSGAWLKVGKSKNGKKGNDPSNGMQHSTGEKTTIQNSAG
jgi:hypothetical protein